MRAWWGRMPWLAVLLVIMAGCRTAPPDVRPKNVPEVCNDPPTNDRRFDTAYMPKEAFKDMKDPLTRNPVTPAGGMGAGGMGAGGMGMGGMNPGMGAGGRY